MIKLGLIIARFVLHSSGNTVKRVYKVRFTLLLAHRLELIAFYIPLLRPCLTEATVSMTRHFTLNGSSASFKTSN